MINIEKGLVFTGMMGCFSGRVEVLSVDKENDKIKVSLTKRIDNERFSQWQEDWELQHTIWGFEKEDYLKCNPASFEDYPPLLNNNIMGTSIPIEYEKPWNIYKKFFPNGNEEEFNKAFVTFDITIEEFNKIIEKNPHYFFLESVIFDLSKIYSKYCAPIK